VRRIVAGLLRRATSVVREAPHLWASYRLLRRTDLVIVAGSGQLLDQWNGPWGHPYALYKWSLLARLTKTPVAILSAGAGPLEGRLARSFIRRAVERAAYVSVRDEGSARVLQEAGVRRDLPVRPDMAFGFASTPPEPRADARFTVGLNPMAHAHPGYWGRGDLSRYEAYVGKLTRLTCQLMEDGATVCLFSSHSVADPPVAEDLVAAVWAADPRLAGRLLRRRITEVDELVDFIGECDAVIASRYHSVLLPLSMGVPTIGIAYHPKTIGLMALAGQSAYCFPDIDEFDVEDLIARARELIGDRAQIHESLSTRVPELRAAVELQFDEVFSITSTGRRSAEANPVSQPERGRHVA
jgi:polysaccharide pyruvyl transferase WcaK-like protein